MAARRVGIRELRENLSRLVRGVRRGEVLEVTDRGEPVARLVPLSPRVTGLEDLVADGTVRPARTREALPAPAELPSRMTSEEAIDLLRGDR
jgi:prevent-host-death family protein